MGDGKEQKYSGRRRWRTQSVPSGQVVPTGPAHQTPIGVQGTRRGGVRWGGVPVATCGTKGVRVEGTRSVVIVQDNPLS